MPPPPIVVPTDLSEPAAEALRYALRVGRASGAEVHLLYAISWPDAGRFEGSEQHRPAAQEEAREAERARAALAEAVREAGGGDDVTVVVRHSNVLAAETRDHVRSVRAGLVVVGALGDGPGAVASELLQTAPCDVLIVPHAPGAPHSASPLRRVLVPVDFSPSSAPLASFAVGLARDLGAEGVDLVHVVEPLPYPTRWLAEALLDEIARLRERAQTALAELAAEVDAAGSGLDVACYVEQGKAARTIPRVADALGDGLIVIGAHAERPVFDTFLGNVAEGVARRSARPVLVARQSAEPAA